MIANGSRDRGASSAAGIYVHIPFCLTRCGYCDFNTYADLGHLSARYVGALHDEAELVLPEWEDVPFVSVFFGGGTPTILPPVELEELLAHLRVLTRSPYLEVTAEANPDTVDEADLASLRRAGITRLSLGVQSFDPSVLTSLERVHSPRSARRAYAAARSSGFRSLNLDLIYGAAGESLESWKRTLDHAIEMAPEHVSCYALTIEPATPLGRKVAAGLAPPPDPDLQASMYEAACAALRSAGYVHYEVSNWAKPGFESVHNLGYWQGRAYLGLGAGAHSYRDARRWWNVRPPRQYVETVERGRKPIGGEEHLSGQEKRLEALLLGMRAAHGVPLEWVGSERAQELSAHGLVRRVDGRVRPTERGMFLANDVVLALAAE